MRSSKSRSRSKNNRNRSMGNIVNRVFDSSGPEGKVRGTPQQIIDKYNQLARDAQLGNDRVATENFQQHAEHYLRMLAEAMKEQAERQAQQQQQRNQNNNQGQNGGQNGGQPQNEARPKDDPKPVVDPGAGDQPAAEVIDVEATSDSALVETPENKPPKPPRRRKPKPQPEASETAAPADAAQPAEPPADAAE